MGTVYFIQDFCGNSQESCRSLEQWDDLEDWCLQRKE